MNGGIVFNSTVLGNDKNIILKALQGLIKSSSSIIQGSTTWKRAVATKDQISHCFVWMNLSKDRISQPVWTTYSSAARKNIFSSCPTLISETALCGCFPCYALWHYQGVWWWCPKNCPSNNYKQISNTSVVSSLPKLSGPAPSASLHRVCVLGTFVGPFLFSLHPSWTEGLPGLPQN